VLCGIGDAEACEIFCEGTCNDCKGCGVDVLGVSRAGVDDEKPEA